MFLLLTEYLTVKNKYLSSNLSHLIKNMYIFSICNKTELQLSKVVIDLLLVDPYHDESFHKIAVCLN